MNQSSSRARRRDTPESLRSGLNLRIGSEAANFILKRVGYVNARF